MSDTCDFTKLYLLSHTLIFYDISYKMSVNDSKCNILQQIYLCSLLTIQINML